MNVTYFPKAYAFVEALNPLLAGRANKMLDLLRNRGYELRMPISRLVEDGIFELRVVGAVHIRFLYFFHAGEAIVAHAFFKKTERLSRKDINMHYWHVACILLGYNV